MGANARLALLGLWLDLEYMPLWKAGVLFALLAAVVLFLGIRSMAGLPPVRKWVSVFLRLAVLATLVLIVAGLRWRREHQIVETLVLRDISQSAEWLYQGYKAKNLDDSVDEYLKAASELKYKHNKEDCIGTISFADQTHVESLSNTTLDLTSKPNREEPGQATDIGSAIQMALANYRRDAMRRMILISDGLNNTGDLETAISAAVAQQVPIDVMKLHFEVQNEVMVEKIAAPSWRRESDTFEISITLLSTNTSPVPGTLRVSESGKPLDKSPMRLTIPAARINEEGKIEPRKYVVNMRVPPLGERGVRHFEAEFEPLAGDTLAQNNKKTAFTFVQGQGKVLYVDNSSEGAGASLRNALAQEGVKIQAVRPSAVPEDLVRLQEYDAVILNNVPRGSGGLSERQGTLLARYVHDFGGGLIMLGGPESMGAGAWQGSKLEEVMPVDFDVPPERQMPKGALVLIVHSSEFDNGRYWGEQCALKAIEALSAQDEVGVITYDWGAMAHGGSKWDYELAPKGNGAKVTQAVKAMQPGDMVTFDDCLHLAFYGTGEGKPGLKNSDAASKHVIIISDGDPGKQQDALLDEYKKASISISTVVVKPHPDYKVMQELADATGGHMYGPISEKDYAQLPQIFIKEAAVVRRTLIQQRNEPSIEVKLNDVSELLRDIPQPPPIRGLVLCTRKPTATLPLQALVDGHEDPLLAHWQAGLGKAAVFTSDAGALWDATWLTPEYRAKYTKLFAQLLRGISRPPMSQDFVVNTERQGDKAVITVEAADKNSGFANDLNIWGTVVDPDTTQHKVQLVQTAPGRYVGEFPTPRQGDYVAALQYRDERNRQGWLVSGVSVDDSPELRELRSNDALLQQIAERTRGRVLQPWDPAVADLFSRQNVPRTSSPMPVWDVLLKILLILVLLDVACRRLAWDWATMRRRAAAVAGWVRSFTTTRQVKGEQTLDALRKVREEVAEAQPKQAEAPAAPPPPIPLHADVKFEAKQPAAADITGEALAAASRKKPVPPVAPPTAKPAESGEHMGGLLAAKRRARENIRKKTEDQ